MDPMYGDLKCSIHQVTKETRGEKKGKYKKSNCDSWQNINIEVLVEEIKKPAGSGKDEK